MAYADLVTAADRAVQGNLGGVAVLYTPSVGQPITVTAIFDENFVKLEEGFAGAEDRTPVAWVRVEDLPIDPQEDDAILTIGAVDYQVRERQLDSLGGVRLYLHEVS